MRVALWAFLLMVLAIVLGIAPSWGLLGLVVAGNVLGRIIYPDAEE